MADHRPTRRQRESRALSTVAVAGGSGVAAAVTFLLALFTSFSWGWFLLFAVVAAVATMMFRRSVN